MTAHPPIVMHLWCSGCKAYHLDEAFDLHLRLGYRRGRQPECRKANQESTHARAIVRVGNILTMPLPKATLMGISYSFGDRSFDGHGEIVNVAMRGTTQRLRTGALQYEGSIFMSMDGTPRQVQEDMARAHRFGWEPVHLQHIIGWYKREMGNIEAHRDRAVYRYTGCSTPLRIDMSTVLHRDSTPVTLEGKRCAQTPEEHLEVIFATTEPGQPVLDLCAGRCALSKAARLTGRRPRAIEIDPTTVRLARLDLLLRGPIPKAMLTAHRALEQQLLDMRTGVPRTNHPSDCPTCWVSLNKVLDRYPTDSFQPLLEGILGHSQNCLFCMSGELTHRQACASTARAQATTDARGWVTQAQRIARGL